jgi:hypothetical protein
VIGWIKQATGSYTWGLLAVAGSVLSTGIIAALIGHDSEFPSISTSRAA